MGIHHVVQILFICDNVEHGMTFGDGGFGKVFWWKFSKTG
jgi:hypothetical protein